MPYEKWLRIKLTAAGFLLGVLVVIAFNVFIEYGQELEIQKQIETAMLESTPNITIYAMQEVAHHPNIWVVTYRDSMGLRSASYLVEGTKVTLQDAQMWSKYIILLRNP